MAINPVTGIKNMTDAVKSLKKELDGVYKTIKQLSPLTASTLKDVTRVVSAGGHLGNGKGNAIFNTDDSNFSTASRNRSRANFLEDGLATSNAQQYNRRQARLDFDMKMAKIDIYKGVATAAVAPAAGLYAAMPDTGSVVSRAAGFYGATFGYTSNRTAVQKSTISALNGKFGRGVSGVGEDAAAAAMLVQGYNYAPGSAAYKQTMGEVGGAFRALNMSNATAAQAIGGFQTGPMGANLYQYGISQFDANGQPVSQAKIAEQLYNRMFNPDKQKVTKKDVQMSLQYGMAGANLRTMGFSQEQQELLTKQFLLKAEGKSMDLSKMKGESNPLKGLQDIKASEVNLAQAGEAGYLKGLEKAAEHIVKLNSALEDLAPTLGQFKGYLETMMASGPGKGMATTGSLLLSAGKSIIGGALVYRGLSIVRSALASKGLQEAGKKATVEATKTVSKKAAQAAARAAAAEAAATATAVGTTAGLAPAAAVVLPAGVLLGTAYYRKKQADKEFNALDRTVALENYKPGKKVGDPGYNAEYEAFYKKMAGPTEMSAGGGGPVGYGASFGGSSSVASSSSKSASQGFQMTYDYKAKDNKTWGTGAKPYHTGQDYAMPEGTPVIAKRAGLVIDENLSPDLGIYVQIDHQDGYQTIYGHLSSKRVHVGSMVNVGDVIGKSGKTGKVTGPHLHLEVRKGKNNPVNPDELYKTNILKSTEVNSFVSQGASIGKRVGNNLVNAAKTAAKAVSSAATGAVKLSYKVAKSAGTGITNWAKTLLKTIGAPLTPDNIYALTEWSAFESGRKNPEAGNNPLNTTLKTVAVVGMKNKIVTKYATPEDGVQATLATLTGNRSKERGYQAILEGLKAGVPYTETFKNIQNSAWVGGERKKSPYKFNFNKGPKTYSVDHQPKGGAPVGYGASFAAKGSYSDVSSVMPQSNPVMESSVLPSLLRKIDVMSSSTSKNSGTTNNVTINVQVQQASEEEAMRLAKRIKQYLKDGDRVAMMGSH